MLLPDWLQVWFVPNVVGSRVAAHIQGHSMSWGYRKYAFSLCHPTIANVVYQSWGCFICAPANPLIVFVRILKESEIVNSDWFCIGIELDNPFF